jgi:S1-C subfamily serine protease
MLISIPKWLGGFVLLTLHVGSAKAAQSPVERCDVLFRQFAQVGLMALQRPGDKQQLDESLVERLIKWQSVIKAGRRYLGECPDESRFRQTQTLGAIAKGMNFQGDHRGAIQVLKRCLSIDPGESSCWLELGEAKQALCQFDDANAAFQKVIENGAFTELTTVLAESAKQEIEILENARTLERLRHVFGCTEAPSEGRGSNGSSNKRFGTGFFVTKQGHILTNNHVVQGCKTLAARNGNPLVLINRDTEADLALLKVDSIPHAVATFRSGPGPKVGDEVIAFGFPLPGILSSEGNVSTGVLSAPSGVGDDPRFVQISAPLQAGNSGGPLLDRNGHVIGVIVAKLDGLKVAQRTGDIPQNVNFAVHWAEIRAFLDQERIDYRRTASSDRLDTSTIAAEAGQFTVGIDCSE